MKRILTTMGATSLMLVASSTVIYAQTSTTGAITGSVRGPDGQPVAGAKVSLSSNQIQRSVVSQPDGSYRIGLLNPGAWTLEVAKEGLQTFQAKITVLTNNDQTVNVKLAGAASSIVEVISTASTVDFTSTTTGMNLDLRAIETLPKGRDFNSLVLLAPGAIKEYDNGTAGASGTSVSGASGSENEFVVDGLSTKDWRLGGQSSSLKPDFIEQVEVQTGGFRPEFSALGGVVNAITKSGSNTTKGSAWTTWDPGQLQARAKRNAYVQQLPPNSRLDYGFELGGPIVKDKLFYYFGLDQENREGQTPLPNADPGLVGSKPKNDDLQFLAKLNWYITPEMQLTFAGSKDQQTQKQDVVYPNAGTVNEGFKNTTNIRNLSLSFDWTITPNLLLTAKIGSVVNESTFDQQVTPNQTTWDIFYYFPGGPGFATHPELAGLLHSNSVGATIPPPYYTNHKQAKIDLSYFLGNHSIKFGFSALKAESANGQALTGPPNAASSNGQFPLLYEVVPAETAPGSGIFAPQLVAIELHNAAVAKSKLSAFYLQDTWEVNPGLRLMYGARMESQSMAGIDGVDVLKFSGSKWIQPRVGVTWDVNRDGKTKLSASFAIYYENIPNVIGSAIYGNQVFTEKLFTPGNPAWSYNNGNPTISNPAGYDLLIDATGQTNHAPVAEGIKLPKRQEITAGFDQVLKDGWEVGIHGKYRKLTDPIEESAISDAAGTYADPGPTGAGQAIVWNPGPTASWTGLNGQHYSSGNTLYPEAYNEFKSVDVTVSKKTDRNYLNFSYTWSRLYGNYQGVSFVNSPTQEGLANYTGAWTNYFQVGTGLLSLDRTHAFKLQDTYRFTLAGRDLNLGLVCASYSGTPITHYNADLDFTGQGGNTPVDGKFGSFGRNHWQSDVDLHLDYSLAIGQRVRVVPYVDCFNLFNTRVGDRTYELAVFQASGGAPDPRLGSDLNWPLGRRYTFGVKVHF